MQSYEKRDGHLCFRPSGDLTFFNVAPFSEAVSAAVTTTGIKLVILDCTEIGIVDSAALGALVRLAQLLMGKEFFYKNDKLLLKATHGLLYYREMNVEEFINQARELEKTMEGVS